jgi:hypothetical protein
VTPGSRCAIPADCDPPGNKKQLIVVIYAETKNLYRHGCKNHYNEYNKTNYPASSSRACYKANQSNLFGIQKYG